MGVFGFDSREIQNPLAESCSIDVNVVALNLPKVREDRFWLSRYRETNTYSRVPFTVPKTVKLLLSVDVKPFFFSVVYFPIRALG